MQHDRPFKPHSYRDFARSLESNGNYGLAALNYEIVLSGTWDRRFSDAIKHVVREEYAELMQQALRKNAVSGELAGFFNERLGRLGRPPQGDLRVTMSWNSDGTDIDLWVIKPDGVKCYYGNKWTKSGGELTEDMRRDTGRSVSGEESADGRISHPGPLLCGQSQPVGGRNTRQCCGDALRRDAAGGNRALYRHPQEARGTGRGVSGEVLMFSREL